MADPFPLMLGAHVEMSTARRRGRVPCALGANGTGGSRSGQIDDPSTAFCRKAPVDPQLDRATSEAAIDGSEASTSSSVGNTLGSTVPFQQTNRTSQRCIQYRSSTSRTDNQRSCAN